MASTYSPSTGWPTSGSWDSATPKDSTGFDWSKWGKVAAGGAGVLAGLMAPETQGITKDVGAIRTGATSLKDTGKGLVGMGGEALGPVLHYFMALANGDPQALLQVTQPERTRVLDQYDTARKSIAAFSPRGGGQASTINASRMKEASDLATVTNQARQAAVGTAANVGTTLTGEGLTAEAYASQALSSVLHPILAQQQSDKQSIIATMEGLAAFLGPLLFAI